jgi:hypothetical protein
MGGRERGKHQYNSIILKTCVKRDGPVFLFSRAVKLAGDESAIIAIVAPHRSEKSP